MKRFIFKILLILIICAASGNAAETEAPEYSSVRHQLGFAGSSISGYGFTYHICFEDFFRIKLAGFFYYDEDNWSDYQIDAVGGAETQFFIYRAENSTVYFFLGASYWYFEDINEFTYMLDDVRITRRSGELAKKYCGGLGLGYEFIFWDNIALNIDVGFQYKRESMKFHSDWIFINPRVQKSFSFGAGLGVGIIL